MTNTYRDDEKKQKNKKYEKGETHNLSFPSCRTIHQNFQYPSMLEF
jgi:hypothetical protein